MNGHHLLEFSNSIDNQTSLSLSKLKIRLATLWVMIGISPEDQDLASTDSILQLHQLSHNHKSNVNESLLKRFKSQSQRKRRKRKRKDDIGSDKNAYSFENHSYNHITKTKIDDNHIINSNRNEKKRRKVKSINLVDSNNYNSSSTNHDIHPERNLTLWIFRINQTISKQNANNIEDKVRKLSKNLNFKS